MNTFASAGFAAALALVAVSAAGCSTKPAEAQSAPDPLGPIRCFAVADDADLTSLTARQLCGGAQSDAPARCFVQADGANRLSESQSLALCYGATSTEPAACAAQAGADGRLTNQTIVQNCAARGAGVATSTDVNACMAEGRSVLRLSDFELSELCAPGSTSRGNF